MKSARLASTMARVPTRAGPLSTANVGSTVVFVVAGLLACSPLIVALVLEALDGTAEESEALGPVDHAIPEEIEPKSSAGDDSGGRAPTPPAGCSATLRGPRPRPACTKTYGSSC